MKILSFSLSAYTLFFDTHGADEILKGCRNCRSRQIEEQTKGDVTSSKGEQKRKGISSWNYSTILPSLSPSPISLDLILLNLQKFSVSNVSYLIKI